MLEYQSVTIILTTGPQVSAAPHLSQPANAITPLRGLAKFQLRKT